jgi:hypothetical protein
VEYEQRDLSAFGILGFLAGLAVVGIVLHIVLYGVFIYLDQYTKKHQPELNPLVANPSVDTRKPPPTEADKFPLPRLETNELGQLRDRRLEEEQILNSYGWVDEKAGTAHIPIEQAIKIVVEQGLPTAPPDISQGKKPTMVSHPRGESPANR